MKFDMAVKYCSWKNVTGLFNVQLNFLLGEGMNIKNLKCSENEFNKCQDMKMSNYY